VETEEGGEVGRLIPHLLVDEGITFANWLRRTINEYISKQKPKKRNKGKLENGA
jgi:hypothetical protein